MALPDFDSDGSLPPGIHAASFVEVAERFGSGSEVMISNEMELRGAIERMAQLYSQSECEAVEPAWNEVTRREMSEDTTQLRLKIEREVAEYLAQKYGLAATKRLQEIAA